MSRREWRDGRRCRARLFVGFRWFRCIQREQHEGHDHMARQRLKRRQDKFALILWARRTRGRRRYDLADYPPWTRAEDHEARDE
jgi:hypothetical protein